MEIWAFKQLRWAKTLPNNCIFKLLLVGLFESDDGRRSKTLQWFEFIGFNMKPVIIQRCNALASLKSIIYS